MWRLFGSLRIGHYEYHKMWSDEEKMKSSTWRELKAIAIALQAFRKIIERTKVGWFTDNQNVVRIVQAGSMKKDLQEIALQIYHFCTQYEISLTVNWIPRSEIEKADYISKMIDVDDWEVT